MKSGVIGSGKIKAEKQKARELRQSQWWKQTIGQGKCYYCEELFEPTELTMDHRVPLAMGGKSTKKNIVPACLTCNQTKGQRLV